MMSENIIIEKYEDINDSSSDSLTKCGDIFIGQDFEMLFFFCTLCEEKCSSVEYFLAHFKATHLGLDQYNSEEQLDDIKLEEDDQIDECLTYLNEPDYDEKYSTQPFKSEYEEYLPEIEQLEEEIFKTKIECNDLNNENEIENDFNEGLISIINEDDDDDENELKLIAQDSSAKSDEDILKSKMFCKYCNQNFDYVRELQNHDCCFSKKKLHQCDICKKIFNRKSNLNIHKVLHDNLKEFSCDICGAAFAHKQNMVVHKRRHTSEKPFKCDHCDKSFVTSTEKISHTRLHTGERKFVCEICGKGHASSSHLTQHRRRHFNIRNYHCPYCEKKFANAYTLKLHQITHEDVPRSHKCSKCQAAFKTKKSLNQHSRIHSETKKYSCKICFKSFAQQPGLYSHMKMHAISK